MNRNDHAYPKVYLYRQIVRAKLFMDDHFGEPIDLARISGAAFFSKFHFIRLFKEIYGLTPHRYLRFVRIERAKQYLKSGRSVTDACYSVGFDSIGSFSALFKRMVGSTPSKYRAMHTDLRADTQRRPLRYIPGCFTGHAGVRI